MQVPGEFKRQGSLLIKNIPGAIEATSYDWWFLIKTVKGKVYLNTHKVSRTTSKQIDICRNWLKDQGIKFIEVDQKLGLMSEGVGR